MSETVKERLEELLAETEDNKLELIIRETSYAGKKKRQEFYESLDELPHDAVLPYDSVLYTAWSQNWIFYTDVNDVHPNYIDKIRRHPPPTPDAMHDGYEVDILTKVRGGAFYDIEYLEGPHEGEKREAVDASELKPLT